MHGVKGTQGETDKVKLTLLDFTTTYFTSASFNTFIVTAAEREQFQSSHSSVGFSHSSFSGFIFVSCLLKKKKKFDSVGCFYCACTCGPIRHLLGQFAYV